MWLKGAVDKVIEANLTFMQQGFVYGLLFFCSTAMLLSCSPSQEKLYKETRSSMYTIVSITVSSDSEEKAAIDKAFAELERLAKLLNFYSEDSEISAINRYAGNKPVRVSPETTEIIEKALYVSENTEGAFDVTVGPLVRLWNFQKKIIPDRAIVKEKLKLVGYKNIVIDKEASTVFLKTKGMQIDLGGIIKGYAADKAVEILKQQGIMAGIVAVAGDIKTFGIKPDGSLWNVGIQNPRQQTDKDEILATVGLSDMAISTSGDYQKFFIKDGRRYHHLLNPKTGYPDSECRSVTVIAKDAAFTDAFATGIFVLGAQKGMDVLNRLNLDGVIIDKDGKIHVTEGLKDKIKWSNGVLE
ncbi:MAG: FAD:protein FMN transferase [Nitrospirae bacterium]|nr:FAD:protein FMN transferase [Nitrospirota bacterium]MCL5976768.1 FAD:protein FMN transferase [Nitrospirota bacterium]